MFKSHVAGLGLALGLACALPLTGCASEGAEDDSASQESDLSANGTDGFWRVVAQDQRKCSFPKCGGVYVSKVNGALSRCADGSVADRCYVAEIDLSALDLPEAQAADVLGAAQAGQVILRTNALGTKKFQTDADGSGTIKAPVLRAVEGWQRLAPTDDASFEGTLYLAKDSGIRCITAPCPSISAAKVNGRKRANIASIDLSTVAPAPSQEELDAAWATLADVGFLFASTDTGLDRDANAVYTQIIARAEEPTEQACGGRGQQQCAQGASCIYDLAAACGSFDAPGHCRATTAMLCPQIVDPVCGCDGQTYGNECMANLAGTSAMSKGACVAPEPEPELPPCHVGGCSSQVCSERTGIITTCEFKAEYACYRSATCERQESGKCGWTQTDALTSCLASHQ